MDGVGTTLIELLEFLLPGFVCAWVFYALSSFPKQSQFERIIQALIFTILIQGISSLLKSLSFLLGKYVSFGMWGEDSDLILSLFSAIGLGLLITYFSNNDKFHKVLRKLNITRETSYASEWFGAFSDNINFIVLHLDGGRRLYGWPLEWPTDSRVGHFVLAQASWVNDDGSQIALEGVKSILIRAVDIEMVEFMAPIEAQMNVQESV